MRKRRPRNDPEMMRRLGGRFARRAEEREVLKADLEPLPRPTLTDCIVAAIEEYQRKHHHRTDKPLCEEAQISEPCLSSFRSGRRNASGDTLNKLYAVLDLQITWKGGKPIDWMGTESCQNQSTH